MTPVVAVIVNYNSGALLSGALRGLNTQAVSSTLVIDNASIDRSWESATDLDGVRLERLDSNVGFAAAMNRAIDLSDEPYVLALNADVDLEDGYVAALAAALDADAGLAGVTGTLRRHNGSIDSTGIQMTTARLATDRREDPASATTPPFGVSGAAALYRRNALDHVGGFWDELFMYWEDTELAWRLRRAGWGFGHVPEATATHARGATSADPTFVEAADFGGRLATIARHEGWAGLLRPSTLLVSLVVTSRLTLRHSRALRTARPLAKVSAGLRARRDDAASKLDNVSAPLLPHPWRAWLKAQLAGRLE